MTERSTGSGGSSEPSAAAGKDDEKVSDPLSGHDERDSAEAKADQYLEDREKDTTAPSADPFE